MMNPQHGRQWNVAEMKFVNLQTTCWKSEGDHFAYVMHTCNRRKYTRLQCSLSPHTIEWLRQAFCTVVWRGIFLVGRNDRQSRFWTWTNVKFALLLHSAPHQKHVWGVSRYSSTHSWPTALDKGGPLQAKAVLEGVRDIPFLWDTQSPTR